MTAKEAIKLRCKDCNTESRDCGQEECFLYGLHRAKAGARRSKAIKDYCKWCLNGHPFVVCSSYDCSIHIYRSKSDSASENPATVINSDGVDGETV